MPDAMIDSKSQSSFSSASTSIMSDSNSHTRRPLPTTTTTPPLVAAQYPGDALWDDQHWQPGPGEATIRLRSNTPTPQLTLYSSWFCPFAQRTWIVCEETGVQYLWREINPYQVDPSRAGGYTKISLSLEEKRRLYPDFIEASPRGLVPAVEHHQHSTSSPKHKLVVWESLPAAEYVDAVFGNGSLMPTDPWERAMTQIWCDHCTHRIQKEYYAALMAKDVAQSRRHLEQCFTECRTLARAMQCNNSGPFFWGDRFSMVDVALAPFWQRMIWVGGHYCNLQFPDDDPDFQRLQVWWEACRSRPSVRATLVCQPRLIASYSDYVTNVATSDFAKMMGYGRGNERGGSGGERCSKKSFLSSVSNFWKGRVGECWSSNITVVSIGSGFVVVVAAAAGVLYARNTTRRQS